MSKIDVVECNEDDCNILVEKEHQGGFEGVFLDGPKQGERYFIPRNRVANLIESYPHFGVGWSLIVRMVNKHE